MAPLDKGAAPDVEVDIDERPGEIVVTLRGELDCTNVAEVEDKLSARLDPARSVSLVFEVAELSFVDSSGLAAMLRAAAKADTVVLREPSPMLREVVAATGLDQVLRCEP
jgi:anti-sigma B factor antagonist